MNFSLFVFKSVDKSYLGFLFYEKIYDNGCFYNFNCLL